MSSKTYNFNKILCVWKLYVTTLSFVNVVVDSIKFCSIFINWFEDFVTVKEKLFLTNHLVYYDKKWSILSIKQNKKSFMIVDFSLLRILMIAKHNYKKVKMEH